MFLITILASIGLYVVIQYSYQRGKKDGIDGTIDYFMIEMKKNEIDADILIDDTESKELKKLKKLNFLPFLKSRRTHEPTTTKRKNR